MKAHVETNSGHSNIIGLRGEGKIHKSKHKEEENAEIKAYLTKLQELVPFMPKNRKLSKLEVIQHVIEYIRDLRHTLGLPAHCPTIPGSDCMEMDAIDLMSQSLSHPTNNASPNTQSNGSFSSSSQNRQPLGVLSPTNNNTSSCSSSPHEIPQILEKSQSSELEARTLSI